MPAITQYDGDTGVMAELSELPPVPVMAALQATLTAPCSSVPDDFKNIARRAAVQLYVDLAPKDPAEQVLCEILVSVKNLSLDCLQQAANAKPDWIQVRELNLRYGLKGAGVAIEIVKALEAKRGNQQPTVSVGSVKVEARGQAIVGNVEAPRPSEKEPTVSGAGERRKAETLMRRR